MMEKRHLIERLATWLLPRRPALLIGSGYALFACACLVDRLPEETLYAGLALMVAGAILTAREKRRHRAG
jgi:hypothetical protein